MIVWCLIALVLGLITGPTVGWWVLIAGIVLMALDSTRECPRD